MDDREVVALVERKTRLSRASAWLTALMIAVGLSVAGPQSAIAARGRPAVARHEFRLNPHDVRAYWTKARMKKALPVDALRVTGASTTDAAIEADVTGSSVVYPYTRYEVTTSYTSFPLSTSGKVFFTRGGSNYVCSGTAVGSANRSVVWTAGHCLHSGQGGQWASRFTFVPAYRDGTVPFGEWPMLEAFAPSQWTGQGDLTYDVAAAVVAPNPQGQRLTDVVGGRPILLNASPQQAFTAYGYPAATPFNGQRMIACESAVHEYGSPGSGDPTLGIGCDMTGGSSGGGWVITNGYLNSNTSYYNPKTPELLYGPYFGAAAASIFSTAQNSSAPVSRYELSITKQGPGTGTVRSSPAGIDCGNDCSETYVEGTSVTVTAEPASGSLFDGWQGAACGTTTSCVVSIDAAKNLIARFTRVHTLTVSKTGDGAGSIRSIPAGIDCGAVCAQSFRWGTSVILEAEPEEGSVLVGWSDAACSGQTCGVTMDEDRSLSAEFRLLKPTTTSLVVEKGTRRIRAYGSVAPSRSGDYVRARLLRKDDGGYRQITTKLLPLSQESTYSARFQRPSGGTCRIRVVYDGSAEYPGSRAGRTFRC